MMNNNEYQDLKIESQNLQPVSEKGLQNQAYFEKPKLTNINEQHEDQDSKLTVKTFNQFLKNY